MFRGVAAGLAAGALWGLVFVAPRMLPGLAAVDIATGRFVVYGLVAAGALALARGRRPPPTRAQLVAAAGFSLLGFTGYYLLLALSIRAAGTEVPSLVIGTIPLWVMLLGKPGHLRWRTLLPGLALTAAGLGLMMAAAAGADGGAPPHFGRGLVLALGALACWTAFALLNARWLKRHPEVEITDWANWLGVATAAGALLLWAFLGTPPAALLARPDFGAFLLLSAALGFGSTWLATILWNLASRRLPASLGGQLIISETLFALAYSFAWDGRWPTAAEAAAAVLFTLGILASIQAHR